MIKFINTSIGYKDKVVANIPCIKLPLSGIVCVIGKNGVGKTTLFKTLTKAIPVSQGSILYGSEDLKNLGLKELAKKQCFIPQNIDASSNSSLKSWILLGLAPYHNIMYAPSSEDFDKVISVASRLDIVHLLESPVSQLSGGELRRAAIARALLQQSDIWLLDEIYSQMDLDAAIKMRQLLRDQAETKLIVISTHCLQTAIKTSDMVLVLNPDSTVFYVKPSEVSSDILQGTYNTEFNSIVTNVSTVDNNKWFTH